MDKIKNLKPFIIVVVVIAVFVVLLNRQVLRLGGHAFIPYDDNFSKTTDANYSEPNYYEEFMKTYDEASIASYPTHSDNFEEALKNVPQIQFFSPLKEPIDLKIVDNKEFCFADYSLSTWNDGTYHMDVGGQARLKIQRLKASGNFSFMVGDGWRGTIEGIVGEFNPVTMSRVVNGWTEIGSEGFLNKTKLNIVLNGKENKIDLNMNLDAIMDIGGDQKYVFKAVYCDELDEWEGVYKQFSTLFGTFPQYIILDYEHNIGKMAVEVDLGSSDPNPYNRTTQEFKDFSYTTNEKHEVIDLKI